MMIQAVLSNPHHPEYGTWMFTVGGCMLLGVAAFIVVRGRKHNRNDQ